MDIRKFLALLEDNGFSFLRGGNGSHQIWINDKGDIFSFPYRKDIYKGIVWQFKRKFCKG